MSNRHTILHSTTTPTARSRHFPPPVARCAPTEGAWRRTHLRCWRIWPSSSSPRRQPAASRRLPRWGVALPPRVAVCQRWAAASPPTWSSSTKWAATRFILAGMPMATSSSPRVRRYRAGRWPRESARCLAGSRGGSSWPAPAKWSGTDVTSAGAFASTTSSSAHNERTSSTQSGAAGGAPIWRMPFERRCQPALLEHGL